MTDELNTPFGPEPPKLYAIKPLVWTLSECKTYAIADNVFLPSMRHSSTPFVVGRALVQLRRWSPPGNPEAAEDRWEGIAYDTPGAWPHWFKVGDTRYAAQMAVERTHREYLTRFLEIQ